MDGTGDFFFGHGLNKLFAVVGAQSIDVIDRGSPFGDFRRSHFSQIGQEVCVPGAVLASRFVPRLDVFEFDAEYRSLKSVHTPVPSDCGVVVFADLAVVAQDTHFRCEFVAVGDDGSGFAIGPEIFTRIKAETAGGADRSGFASLVKGAVGLTGVFDYRQTMFFGDFDNGVEIGRLAVEVNGDNRFGSGGDGRFELFRIHVECGFLYIHKDRSGATERDGFGGGDESVGDRNDFVAGTNSEGQ